MKVLNVLQELEQNLFLPKTLESCQLNEFSREYICKVQYGIVDDCSVLSCGCCLSNALYNEMILRTGQDGVRCPTCDCKEATIIGPVKQLRNLYQQIQNVYRKLEQSGDGSESESAMDENFPKGEKGEENSQKGFLGPGNQKSLLALFHMVASKLGSQPGLPVNVTDSTRGRRRNGQRDGNECGLENDLEEMRVLDNASNTGTIPISQNSISASVKNNFEALTRPISTDEEKEYYFAQCFPIYRKRSQYSTHSKFLRTKSKLFISMAISPDCTKFVLITEHKWEVYSILPDKSPVLLFCGKSTGEYGPDFDHLAYPPDRSVLLVKGDNPLQKDLWDQLHCKLSNDFLIISGSKNRFRVFDLNQQGLPIHSYGSSFPIRCIDINSSSNVIACGITGRDRNTGAEQALIVFHKIERNKVTSEPEFLSPSTITLPYRDPIKTLQFSDDGLYLSCSTAFESRFLIISLRKFNEPRLIMKSLRSIDSSLESEGITDVKLFPGNPSLMCVTSAAFNAPPIVVNTKIQDIDGVQRVAQPTMLIRLDELGSKIHKCEISPRNDSIAFLNRNGSVYIMFSPTMMDSEKRRIVLVDMVADAYRAHESAALKFSADGHKLYVLDRKGILYVEDFSYGLPQEHEVTKCKQIT